MKKIVGVIILAALVGGGYYWYQQNRFKVFVDFKKAHGLTQGSLVTLKGVPIGEVTGIALLGERVRVELEIASQSRTALRTDSTFFVESVAGIPQLQAVVIEPSSPQAVKEQVFTGAESKFDLYTKLGGKKLKELIGDIKDSELVDKLEDTLNQPESTPTAIPSTD